VPDLSIVKIEYRTFFGECIGYCRESISITPKRTVYRKQANPPSDELPDKVLETDTSASLWDRLSDAIDMSAVLALPERIGQPDAADQGAESVEISVGGTTKTVEFDRGRTIPALDRLMAILRPLQADLSARIGE
jgi:hypothetical protein